MYTKLMSDIEEMNATSCMKLQELGLVEANIIKRTLQNDDQS